MSTKKQTEATNKAENLDNPTAGDSGRLDTNRNSVNYPNQANESSGAGSPYGGTKTADGNAPDGNQQINTGAADDTDGKTVLPEGMGDEYGTKSSYGDKGSNKEGDDNGPGDARGFVNR
jgi:hypothetical protein